MLLAQDSNLPEVSSPATNNPPAGTLDAATTATTEATPSPATQTADSASDTLALWMWLPFVIAMGFWLYIRGRNQAAQRAQAEALSAKKPKKSARPQLTEYRNDETSGSISKVTAEKSASGKGNSKKNKKDKQKKKQTSPSAAATGQTPATPQPIATAAKRGSAKSYAESTVALSPDNATPAARPTLVSAPAIFEPLRKVSAPTAFEKAISASDESDSAHSEPRQEDAPPRRRRPSPPPPVITTPTKISSGRFEKLNVPASSAVLAASSANRWPAEAARPVEPARPVQATHTPRPKTAAARSSAADATVPPIARGLSGFVKVARASSAIDAANGAEDASAADANSNNG